MPRVVANKLKVIDVPENDVVEEKTEEVQTAAEEMTSIKEEIECIEPSEPVVMKPKRKSKPIEEIKE